MQVYLKNGRLTNLFEVYDDKDYRIAMVELFFDDKKYWLNQITLEGDCHGKNYGSDIIKYLAQKFRPFRVSLSSKRAHYNSHAATNSADTRCLTSEGFHLSKKCFLNGILTRQNFEFPYSEELLEYKVDRFLDNNI